MRRAKWILMAALLPSLTSSPLWAGDQHFRRWWGIGYGDGYHACQRCCGNLYYPYYAGAQGYGPYVPLPSGEPVPAPTEVEPAARLPESGRFSASARLPRRFSTGPGISR